MRCPLMSLCMSALPLSAVPFRLKRTSFARTNAGCSGQLSYRSSAVFYSYLLIEGMGESFSTKDGDVFLPAFSLLRIEGE